MDKTVAPLHIPYDSCIKLKLERLTPPMNTAISPTFVLQASSRGMHFLVNDLERCQRMTHWGWQSLSRVRAQAWVEKRVLEKKNGKATKANSHRNMDAEPTASFPACDCQIWPAGLDRFWYCWCWAWNRWRLECPAFYWLETLSEERIYCDTDLEYAGIRMMIFPCSSWHPCLGVLGKCSWGWLVRSMSSTLHHHAFNKWQHFCQETQIRKPWILGRRVLIVSDFLQVEWCVQEDCTAAVWGVQASLRTLKSPWCLCSIQGKYDSMIFYEHSTLIELVNEVFCASISIYSTEHMMLWLTNCACAVNCWHQ